MSHASIVSIVIAAASLLVACGPAATTDPPPDPTQQHGSPSAPIGSGDVTRPSNDMQTSGATGRDLGSGETPYKPHPTGKIWQVTIDGDQFTPMSLTLGLGDTVQFTWTDGNHSVTSGFDCMADGMFESGSHGGPSSYRVTFLRPGVFPYFSQPQCDVMKGMLIVKDQ